MTQHFNDDIQRQIDKMDLNSPPPIEEPRRQYWFIKKCREIVKRKSEEMGRPLSACTVNMGCQMNTEREIIKSRYFSGFFCFYGIIESGKAERDHTNISSFSKENTRERTRVFFCFPE